MADDNQTTADTHRDIVCDNGTGMTRAGFSGDDAPRVVFPSIVGRPKPIANSPIAMRGSCPKSYYVGDEARARRGILKIATPINYGSVCHWDEMEQIWHHTFFDELRIDPERNNILLTEAITTPKADREKLTQIMFEKFKVGGLSIASQAVLSLYAAGRTNGLVVDSGASATHTVPILEGHTIPQGINRLDLAGRDLSHYLMKLLVERDCSVTKSSSCCEQEIYRDVKEKTCYVALDFDEEMKKEEKNDPSIETQFELPDTSVITVKSQRFRCPEALFKPHLVGLGDNDSIPTMVTKSIAKCDMDVRKELFANVVLSGGNTMFPGIAQRLAKELVAAGSASGLKDEPRVIAPPERKYSAWIGGSILSSLTSFQEQWIRKSEYEENGVQIVHQKCLQ